MYAIRVYKSQDTNKNLGARLVDESTTQFRDLEWKELTSILRANPNSIYNLELDKYNRARLKNMNPNKTIKYYNKIVSDITIYQYCIIINTRVGKLSFIADGINEIHYGTDMTLGEIATALEIPDIDKLNLYNAYTVKKRFDYEIWVWHGGNYRKVQSLNVMGTNKMIGPGWKFTIDTIGQDGIRLMALGHKKLVYEATIPNCVSHIEIFEGGVNHLHIPFSVKSLGEGCFEESHDLYSVELGKGLHDIPDDCFRDSILKKINNLTYIDGTIGSYAFEYSTLQGKIETRAKTIEEGAFAQTDIKSLVTAQTEMIGKGAFEYCSKLEDVVFGNPLKAVRACAFRGCNKLDSIVLPPSTVFVGTTAFKDCTRLRVATVPSSCNVEGRAFPSNCKVKRY